MARSVLVSILTSVFSVGLVAGIAARQTLPSVSAEVSEKAADKTAEKTSTAATLTFSEHVAPIIYANCSSCHRPGQAGPFSLLSHADVRKRGRMIARVTKRRLMPPWHPVEGHGDFVGAMRLTDGEIDTLARWVKAGMPEGDPAKAPAPPEFSSEWVLGPPDMIIKMKEGFEVPAGGPDIYRSFVIPLELEEDKWLTAIEVRPSARSVLHHALFNVDPRRRFRRREGRDGMPGFASRDGGSGQGMSTSGLGGWAVGGQPRHLPMGLARKLPAGSDLVLDSHFHPSGKKEIEQTTLGLYFAKKPPERTMVGLQLPPVFGIAAGLDIPAGEANFKLEESFTLPVDALAVTVGGHAHYICREMKVVATPPAPEAEADGAAGQADDAATPTEADSAKKKAAEPRSIFWIDNWAFNWQNRYQYDKPLELAAGTKIHASLTYDNSEKNPSNPFSPPRRIRWGLQSTDEMGSITVLLVAKNEDESAKLRRAIRRHRGRHMRRGQGGWQDMLISQIRMMDKDGDGLVEKSEVPKSSHRWIDFADLDNDGAVSHDELDKAADELKDPNGRRPGRRRRRSRN